MPAKTCQYGNCLNEVEEQGIVVSLKTPTWDDEKRGIYCCALHASLALLRLAMDRKEQSGQVIRQKLEAADPALDFVPRRWRTT